jgi:hypothetical protein
METAMIDKHFKLNSRRDSYFALVVDTGTLHRRS